MNKLYDSMDEAFLRQLRKIKCLHAEKVYSIYKQNRYGIKSCDTRVDLQRLSDIKHLMEYNESLDLSIFTPNTYRNSLSEGDWVIDECLSDYKKESLNVCNVSKLIETINVL